MMTIVRMVLGKGFLCAGFLALLCSSLMKGQSAAVQQPDAYTWNDRAPDPRFKADILVVVAHPDDETMVAAYLAREIYDNQKRVAVVYGTRGGGGNNMVGPEQAATMSDIREIEGRQAVGSLGITNVWFLSGHDFASQDVLNSLAFWGHGACLDQLVRLVRLTRPSVVLTFLPDFTTGENHSDHQAAGVLATEAFDIAGDPTAFPEQVSPTHDPDKNGNLTEALRPWQPEKIYYFYNPTHDIFAGQGPQYSAKDISPSRHESYGILAAKAFTHHRTQGGDEAERMIERLAAETSQNQDTSRMMHPVKLIFGKSLVPSAATDDVFAGVVAGDFPYRRAPGYTAVEYAKPALEIGDPWSYYKTFWQAHGLDHLASLVPAEITIKVGSALVIPLVVENPLDTNIAVDFSVQAPDGWKVAPVAPASIGPHTRYYLRVQAAAPSTKSPGWQEFTVSAKSGNTSVGTVQVRAELSTGWVAPQ